MAVDAGEHLTPPALLQVMFLHLVLFEGLPTSVACEEHHGGAEDGREAVVPLHVVDVVGALEVLNGTEVRDFLSCASAFLSNWTKEIGKKFGI